MTTATQSPAKDIIVHDLASLDGTALIRVVALAMGHLTSDARALLFDGERCQQVNAACHYLSGVINHIALSPAVTKTHA